MKKLIDLPYSLWALLALPSVVMVLSLLQGGSGSGAEDILGAAGAMSAFLLIVTLALSPLLAIFPKSRAVAWLMHRRKYFGVASFGYALAHVVLYFVGQGPTSQVLDNFLAPAVLRVGWPSSSSSPWL